MDVMDRAASLQVKRAPPTTQNGSTFQGSKVNISDQDDIIPAIHAIMKDTKTARGTHMIYAYRLSGTNNQTIEHYEDDGEYGAGRRLLNLLQEKDRVTRWHCGPNIGRARFTFINDAANAVLSL